MTHEEYEQRVALILLTVPVEFHAALAQMAYDDGHSAGYEEVILILRNLVNGLAEPIRLYGERMRSTN